MSFFPSPTIEDYLWMIFTLQRDGEEVIGARLAELLEVSAPTITATLKRMVRDGWVKIDGKKKIILVARFFLIFPPTLFALSAFTVVNSLK